MTHFVGYCTINMTCLCKKAIQTKHHTS